MLVIADHEVIISHTPWWSAVQGKAGNQLSLSLSELRSPALQEEHRHQVRSHIALWLLPAPRQVSVGGPSLVSGLNTIHIEIVYLSKTAKSSNTIMTDVFK